MLKKIFLLCILTFVCKSEQCSDSKLIVETKSGKIKGACSFININDTDEASSSKSNFVYSFFSIPYAEPPINENRFKAPKAVRPWNNILDGTKIPNSCMQYINTNSSERIDLWFLFQNSSSRLSEDCLYLNIHLSHNIFNNPDTRVPVLVFFHGGFGSTVGSGSLDIYDPSIFVLLTDIIVVTVNYRLDIFGFLYLKDKDQIIEGNQGILDQNMALKWVYENIQNFNGDPNRITLMGSDSGAKLAGYHLFFKQSWPYFRNIILQSGSPVNLGKNAMTTHLASSRAEKFIKEVYGCKDGRLISCLNKIDGLNLTLSSRLYLKKRMSNSSLFTSMFLKSIFGPVVDEKYFKQSPFRAFRLDNFKKCNMLIGFNQNDGFSSIPPLYGSVIINQTNHQIINYTMLADFLKKYYHFYPTWPFNNSDLLLNSILHEYTSLGLKFDNSSYLVKNNYFKTLGKIITDESFICPIFKLLDYLSKKDIKAYLYNFNYRLSNSKWPKWYGAVRGDELPFVFGHALNSDKNRRFMASYNPWYKNTFSQRDKEVAKEVIKRWSNFIRYNDPNDGESSNDWLTYSFPETELDVDNNKNLFSFLLIANDSFKMNRFNSIEKCFFWNNFIPTQLDFLAEMKRNEQVVKSKC